MLRVRCMLLAACLVFAAEGTGRISCALVLCAKPKCPYPIPADPRNGRCCPTCPLPTEPPTLDCSLVSCFVPCSNPDPPPKGECCPICPEPPTLDCRVIFCAKPKCKKPLPPPKGECCPVCPDPPTEPPADWYGEQDQIVPTPSLHLGGSAAKFAQVRNLAENGL